MSATQEQRESLIQRQNQIRTMSRKLDKKKTKSPELNKIISFIPDSYKKFFIYRHYSFNSYVNSYEFRNKIKTEKDNYEKINQPEKNSKYEFINKHYFITGTYPDVEKN